MFYRGYPFSGFTADGVFNRIRIEEDVGIRDGTDIHIREGTGLGSRNEEKPTTGKPPEWEWYAQLPARGRKISAELCVCFALSAVKKITAKNAEKPQRTRRRKRSVKNVKGR
jgi:hypothetical protein